MQLELPFTPTFETPIDIKPLRMVQSALVLAAGGDPFAEHEPARVIPFPQRQRPRPADAA